jgi:hypothetical protein
VLGKRAAARSATLVAVTRRAVFELVDDLRETIWSIYQTNLQDLTRQQRQSPAIDRIEIDDDDLPF